MKTSITSILTCVLFSAYAADQQCQVAMGVPSSNTGCSEDILDEIKLYIQILYRDECTPSSRRKLLRGEEDGRELQTQQQCDTWQLYCTLGINPQYYCQAYASCIRRDLQEDAAETPHGDSPTRHLLFGEPTENPLEDPGWEPCTLNFGQFVKNVKDDFMSTYATSEIRECWKHMWCRVKPA